MRVNWFGNIAIATGAALLFWVVFRGVFLQSPANWGAPLTFALVFAVCCWMDASRRRQD